MKACGSGDRFNLHEKKELSSRIQTFLNNAVGHNDITLPTIATSFLEVKIAGDNVASQRNLRNHKKTAILARFVEHDGDDETIEFPGHVMDIIELRMYDEQVLATLRSKEDESKNTIKYRWESADRKVVYFYLADVCWSRYIGRPQDELYLNSIVPESCLHLWSDQETKSRQLTRTVIPLMFISGRFIKYRQSFTKGEIQFHADDVAREFKRKNDLFRYIRVNSALHDLF